MSEDLQLKGRVALVTGASRGIGYQAALQLAQHGVHVIALARTVGGLEELDDAIKAGGGEATLVPLDMTNFDGLDRLGAAIFERWGKLDILLANGAILGSISPIGHFDPKEFEKVMNVNVMAQWRLIRSMDPLLRKSDAGRALFMSSSVAHSCRAFWGLYGASKAAGEAMMCSWAHETQNTPLNVISINPGATRTAMRAQAVPGEDPVTLPSAADVAARIIPLTSPLMGETNRLFDIPKNCFLDYPTP